MKFRKLGLFIAPIFIFGLVACATAPEVAPTEEEPAMEEVAPMEEEPVAEEVMEEVEMEPAMAEPMEVGDVTFTSKPAARGNMISVISGNSVKISLTAPGAGSISASGAPPAAIFTDMGATAALKWETTEADVLNSPYMVNFDADTGHSLMVTIEVLRAK